MILKCLCVFATSKTNNTKTSKTNNSKTVKTNNSKTIKTNNSKTAKLMIGKMFEKREKICIFALKNKTRNKTFNIETIEE